MLVWLGDISECVKYSQCERYITTCWLGRLFTRPQLGCFSKNYQNHRSTKEFRYFCWFYWYFHYVNAADHESNWLQHWANPTLTDSGKKIKLPDLFSLVPWTLSGGFKPFNLTLRTEICRADYQQHAWAAVKDQEYWSGIFLKFARAFCNFGLLRFVKSSRWWWKPGKLTQIMICNWNSASLCWASGWLPRVCV